MAAFFSGTDTSTLQEEGTDRNNFVSLIVNNAGTYTAAITRMIHSEQKVEDCISYEFFGEGKEESCENYTRTEDYIEYFMLDITKEGGNSFQELDDRLNEIKKAKEAKKPVYSSVPYFNSQVKSSYTPKEPTLFTNPNAGNVYFDDDFDYKPMPTYAKTVEKDTPSTFKPDVINSLVLQLLTGSVIIPNDSKIDKNKWVSNMVPLFEKRFGKGKEGFSNFQRWAEGFVDYIMMYTDNEYLTNLGMKDDEITVILGDELITALASLPQNAYIKEYIDLLNIYIQ